MINKNNKSILIISYKFPPIKGIGSLRPYYISHYLQHFGWDVYVLTTTNDKLMVSDNNFSQLKTKNKFRLPTFDLQTIKYIVKNIIRIGKKRNSSQKVINKEKKVLKSYSLKNKKFMLQYSFPFNLSYEGGMLFIISSFIKGLRLIKQNKIKYVLSTHGPYPNSIIGSLLKFFKKDIVWIADFRDLAPGDWHYDFFFPGFQVKLNKLIFRRSDLITSVSEGLDKRLKKYNKNTKVIRNGIPFKVNYFNNTIQKKDRENKFIILYTGTVYYERCDAKRLFEAIRWMIDNNEIEQDDIRLIYAGKDSSQWIKWAKNFDLTKNIEIRGFLDRNEVIKLQSKASINLLLTWSNKEEKGIVTGKFYEYLATQNPILCMISGEKDQEIENLFTSLNCGLVVYKNEAIIRNSGIVLFIKKKYMQWKKNGAVLSKYNIANLKNLTYEKLTRDFEDILLNNIYSVNDKNKEIQFSVVMPLYNKERHVTRAIDSVLGQTYKKFELIIINDASTDKSVDIVKSYKDKRIKLYNRKEKSAGGYAARNLGIEKSKYDYIAFIDSDDEWKERHLDNITDLISLFPDAGAYCSNYYRGNKNNVVKNKYNEKIRNKLKPKIISNYFNIAKYEPLHTSVMVVKKVVFYNVGVFPAGKCDRNGDVETWMRIALKYSIAWTPLFGGIYHIDSDNMTTKNVSYSRVPYIRISAEKLIPTLSKKERKKVKKIVNYTLRWRILQSIKEKKDIEHFLDGYYKEVNYLKFYVYRLLNVMPNIIIIFLSKINALFKFFFTKFL